MKDFVMLAIRYTFSLLLETFDLNNGYTISLTNINVLFIRSWSYLL